MIWDIVRYAFLLFIAFMFIRNSWKWKGRADTGGNDLPGPSREKLIEFVGQLRDFVPELRLKKNISRLWPDAEVT